MEIPVINSDAAIFSAHIDTQYKRASQVSNPPNVLFFLSKAGKVINEVVRRPGFTYAAEGEIFVTTLAIKAQILRFSSNLFSFGQKDKAGQLFDRGQSLDLVLAESLPLGHPNKAFQPLEVVLTEIVKGRRPDSDRVLSVIQGISSSIDQLNRQQIEKVCALIVYSEDQTSGNTDLTRALTKLRTRVENGSLRCPLRDVQVRQQWEDQLSRERKIRLLSFFYGFSPAFTRGRNNLYSNLMNGGEERFLNA